MVINDVQRGFVHGLLAAERVVSSSSSTNIAAKSIQRFVSKIESDYGVSFDDERQRQESLWPREEIEALREAVDSLKVTN